MSKDNAKVIGYQTDSSGETYGVWGEVDSSSGYGLYSPDDVKIGGVLDTTGYFRVNIDGNSNLLHGADASGGEAGNVVMGHSSNIASAGDFTFVQGATIAGGGFDDGSTEQPNTVLDNFGTVSGGQGNQAGSDDGDPTIDRYATVGGGKSNTASGNNSTVGGGKGNTANATSSTVGGGNGNTASGIESAVGGGDDNTASSNKSTVGGGEGNTASDRFSTVGGGFYNTASDGLSTVGGGNSNTASGSYSVVGGGEDNTASGTSSTVPGGERGAAESASSFVWNDASFYHAIPNTDSDGLSSDTAVDGESVTGSNTFSVSATNGFRFMTGSDSSPSVVTLADDGTNAELTFHSDLPDESGARIGIDSNGKLVKSPSSARYKTNIQPLSTDTSAVLDLEPKAFEYEDSGQESTGLIAEDVDEVLPELVYDDEEGNPESVHYDRVGVYLVPEVDENRDRLDDLDETTADHEACIDDLEDENERKDERIDDLEAENERLRDRLAVVENHLGLDSSADPAPADD